MSNLDDNNKLNGSTDPIIPIDFTPNDGKKAAVAYQFRWTHAFVALFLLVTGSAAWFVLTARSVFVEVNPITATIAIEGGISFRLGQRYLIRTGSYQLSLSNEGYHDTVTRLLVSEEQSQTHPFTLRKLPGIISFSSADLVDARIRIDGVDLGLTPLSDVAVEAGEHQLSISKDRYLDYGESITIEGRSVVQSYQAKLEPAWATVSISTTPGGADVLVDGEVVGTTPLNAEILQGRRDFVLKLAGHKAWQEEFDVFAGKDFSVPLVQLEPADGLVFIRSNPSAASVTIGGEFKGLTPLEVALPPTQEHELVFFKNGYHSRKTSLRTEANQERELNIQLDPVLAKVSVLAQPEDAELYVNGEFKGVANQTLELMAASQQIEIRKAGFVPYSAEFTSRPGLDQVIRVTLKSLEQSRQEQIKPLITSAAGQTLKLFYPGAFTMGASRREAGRRPNESLRDIKLERPFYLSLKEVSNAEFRLFNSEHTSGTVRGLTLDNEAQPVVRVTWNQAALFCNWLSDQESLANFYEVVDGEVVGFNRESIGYRLPTEAEWAWVARTDGSGSQLKYAWGEQLPPTENSGNFADISSQSYLGEVLFNYNDGYLATAPVASFKPNQYEVYDMAGNVAEWVHDFYGAVGSIGGVEIDPLGPSDGQFHTIRGSSWAHGSITELRLSFRDFGEEVRDDVGFRVARYLEE
ncbi:MAG: PEGA domain-containing protein [Pseudohongiella sp.]|jgi:formylglycine-generating enzyme required for sulfatase activity|nr:PEGA domain-containing protein [Pseudohongiella sp.]